MNSSSKVNLLRNLGQNVAGQWAFRDEGPVSMHVIAGRATKPTRFATKRELPIGAEDGVFFGLKQK